MSINIGGVFTAAIECVHQFRESVVAWIKAGRDTIYSSMYALLAKMGLVEPIKAQAVDIATVQATKPMQLIPPRLPDFGKYFSSFYCEHKNAVKVARGEAKENLEAIIAYLKPIKKQWEAAQKNEDTKKAFEKKAQESGLHELVCSDFINSTTPGKFDVRSAEQRYADEREALSKMVKDHFN